MIIEVQGTKARGGQAGAIAVMIAGMEAFSKGKKTLLISLRNNAPGNDIEDFILAPADTAQTNDSMFGMASGINAKNVDTLIRDADTNTLNNDSFDMAVTPIMKIKNGFDFLGTTQESDFEKMLPRRVLLIDEIIEKAKKIYDCIIIYVSPKTGAKQDYCEVIDHINESVDKIVAIIKQGRRRNVIAANMPPADKTAYIIADYESESKWSVKRLKKDYSAQHIFILPHNIQFRDAKEDGVLPVFCRKNVEVLDGNQKADYNYPFMKELDNIVSFVDGGEKKEPFMLNEALVHEFGEKIPPVQKLEDYGIPVVTESTRKKGLFGKPETYQTVMFGVNAPDEHMDKQDETALPDMSNVSDEASPAENNVDKDTENSVVLTDDYADDISASDTSEEEDKSMEDTKKDSDASDNSYDWVNYDDVFSDDTPEQHTEDTAEPSDNTEVEQPQETKPQNVTLEQPQEEEPEHEEEKPETSLADDDDDDWMADVFTDKVSGDTKEETEVEDKEDENSFAFEVSEDKTSETSDTEKKYDDTVKVDTDLLGSDWLVDEPTSESDEVEESTHDTAESDKTEATSDTAETNDDLLDNDFWVSGNENSATEADTVKEDEHDNVVSDSFDELLDTDSENTTEKTDENVDEITPVENAVADTDNEVKNDEIDILGGENEMNSDVLTMKKVYELYEDGFRMEKVAEKAGVTVEEASSMYDKYKARLEEQRKLKEKIKALYDEGYRVEKVAEKAGVSVNAAKKVLGL